MSEVIIKLEKMLKDEAFFKFIVFNDLMRNLAFEWCDPYMGTAVAIRFKYDCPF
jgi:hypothetical protein